MNVTTILMLLKMEFIELKRPLLNCVIATLLLMIVLAYKMNQYEILGNVRHIIPFAALLIFVGFYLCGSLFWQFKTSYAKQNYLSLPASHIEKLVSKSIIILPVFISAVYIAHFLYGLMLPPMSVSEDNGVGLSTALSLVKITPSQVLIYFLTYHSIFILSSAYFERYALLKASLLLVVTKIFVLVGVIWINKLLGSAGSDINLQSMNFSIDLSTAKTRVFTDFIGLYIVPPACWVFTYYVLKSKRV